MNMNSHVPVNWFDVLLLIVLLVGYSRGRKHGMSKELLQVVKWVAVVLVSAIAYEPLGLWLDSMMQLGKLTSFVIAYSITAVFTLLLFAYLNTTVGRKLAGSDTFGKGEFYLAMPAGMLRFACVILALLALLNARLYRTAEIKAMQKFQMDNYGSQFFPTLASIQVSVFEESFTGPQIRKYISFLLIKPTYPSGPEQKNTASRRREFTLP
jgi:Colicin V production protein